MVDKKTIIKLKTLKESANRDFTEADLAQREIGFNEKDNGIYVRRSDGEVVKTRSPNPGTTILQYNSNEVGSFDGNTDTTINFEINAENLPLSSTDNTSVSDKIDTKLDIAEAETTYATKAEIPTELPNPEALTINYNGIQVFTYDGSTAETGNFIVNAETVPMSETNSDSIAQTIKELCIFNMGNFDSLDAASERACNGGVYDNVNYRFLLFTVNNESTGLIINNVDHYKTEQYLYYDMHRYTRRFTRSGDIAAVTPWRMEDNVTLSGKGVRSSLLFNLDTNSTNEEIVEAFTIFNGDGTLTKEDFDTCLEKGMLLQDADSNAPVMVGFSNYNMHYTLTYVGFPTPLFNNIEDPQIMSIMFDIADDGTFSIFRNPSKGRILTENYEKLPVASNISVIYNLNDRVYSQASILGWFDCETIDELKSKIKNSDLMYMTYINLEERAYRIPIEYIELKNNDTQLCIVTPGLTIFGNELVKYEITANLDGTIIEENRNVKVVKSVVAMADDIPTTLPNPEALTVTVNKEAFVTYDGSTAVTQDLVMNAETIPLNADTTLTVAYGLEQVTPLVAQIPIRTLQDKVYDQETILGWFSQESVADIKQKIVRNAPVFVKYGIQLSGNPHYYKFPVEYCAFESANQIKMVFQGLNTKDDVVSKYEIIINLDGTVIEGNSNVKVSITSLENKSYNDLTNKPSINNVELSGNKTLENLGIQPAGEYLVASDIANKADKATTLAGYGITDAYTKSEVDSKLSTVYEYKGSVATYEELPSANNEVGDVYNVETDGSNYAWDGTTWDKLGGTVDLSNYYTKSQVDTELGKKLDITTASSTYATITTVNGKADKADTLAGYGIEDAYTKSEVDSKLDTKQNTLSTEQLDAVNSGITAAHITAYDAYAGEISAAQTTANKADNAAEVAQQTANLVGTNLQTVTEKIPTSASSSNLLVDTASMNESLLSKLSFKQITVPANNWYIYAEAPKDEVTTFYVDGANYFNAKIPEMIVIGLSSTKVSSVSTMAYDDSVTTLSSSYGSKQYYETDDKIRIAIKSSSEIQVNVYFDPNSNLTVLDTPVLPTSEDGSAKSVKSATLPSLSYLTNYFVKNDGYENSLGSMYNFSFGVFTNNEQMPSDNRTLVLSLGDGIYDDTGANSSTNYFSLLAIDKTTKKLYLFVGDETNLTRQSWKEITTLEELNAVQSEINTSLGNKADKATTLSGYGITDAYTSEEVDNKLSQELATKQDSLTTEQLNAVNSGITAEKVTEYDNYVAMIIREL